MATRKLKLPVRLASCFYWAVLVYSSTHTWDFPLVVLCKTPDS